MSDVLLERHDSGGASGEPTPGQRLKVAREAKNMSYSEVAAKLHLGEDMVLALEADDYSGLPDPVFIKGYLRKYARLVNVPDEPLLAAYARTEPSATRQTRLAVSGVKQEIRSSHFLVRSISWLILIGSLALLGLWLKDYFQELSLPSMPAEEPIDEVSELSATIDTGVTEEPLPLIMENPAEALSMEPPALEGGPSAQSGGDEKPAISPPAAEAPVPVAATVPATAETVKTIQSQQRGGTQSQMAATASTVIAATPATAPTQQSVAAAAEERAPSAPAASQPQVQKPEGLVVLEIEADSWVDLRDSSGSYRILGNLAKGERRVLEGTPPYSVVLGNSKAVKISVRGEPFDIGPYTRGNVARFRLDPDQP